MCLIKRSLDTPDVKRDESVKFVGFESSRTILLDGSVGPDASIFGLEVMTSS